MTDKEPKAKPHTPDQPLPVHAENAKKAAKIEKEAAEKAAAKAKGENK